MKARRERHKGRQRRGKERDERARGEAERGAVERETKRSRKAKRRDAQGQMEILRQEEGAGAICRLAPDGGRRSRLCQARRR